MSSTSPCMRFAAGLSLAVSLSGWAETPAAAPQPAWVADVEALIDALAPHGVTLVADADRAPLYECLARTVDPGARVFRADEFAYRQKQQSGLDYHAGFQLTMSNATPIVAAVPAESTVELKPGDRLLAINGVSTTNTTLSEALDLLRGREATNIELNVSRGATGTATVSVALALAPIPLFETQELWPRDIGYARVNGFTAGPGAALLALLRDWQSKGLAGGILDLRGAGGDDVEAVALVAGPWASPGSLLYTVRDLNDNDLVSHRADASAGIDLPLMVLVDGRTTGAAEIFAALAADSLRGVLVIGRTTAGDPGIRTGVALPGDVVLYIATRRLVTGNGMTYDGRSGVTPNILVTSGPRNDYEPEPGPDRRQRLEVEDADRALRDRVRGDAALQRAVDVLLGLKALNIKTGAVSSR